MIRHVAALLLVTAAPAAARAQTHNALRDPRKTLFAAYPEADGYRSLERSVDEKSRRAIIEALPFDLHFDELGKHALYVAMRGRRPVGFLQVRTESSKWGLVEIGWSLTVDLRVGAFTFHRCRSSHANAVRRSAFSRLMVGKDIADLRTMVGADGSLKRRALGVPLAGQDLAAAVVRSGLIAMVVIDVVWGGDLDKLREQEMGLEAFPRAAGIWALQPDPKTPSAAPGGAAPVVLRAVRARDGRGQVLGTVAVSEFLHGRSRLRLRWTLGPEGNRVLGVSPEAGWPDGALRSAFLALNGRRFSRDHSASNAAERVAIDVIDAVSRLQDPGRQR